MDEGDQTRRTLTALLELCRHIVLMDVAMGSMPNQVQEGWQERLEHIESAATSETLEIQQFGEAFDGEEDENPADL